MDGWGWTKAQACGNRPDASVLAFSRTLPGLAKPARPRAPGTGVCDEEGWKAGSGSGASAAYRSPLWLRRDQELAKNSER